MALGLATMIHKRSVLSSGHWTNLRSWHREHGRHNLPWRLGSTPWKVLLAEVLLHRTRASAVGRLYDEVLKKFPVPEAIVGRPADWLETTSSAGLAWRSRVFISTCDRLVTLYRGSVPSGWADLISLPGIGHYIASAVRCFGFGFPEVIVDINTIRLASRITGESLNATHHRSRKVKQAVASILANGTASCVEDNYALLDLAALVCPTKKPLCGQCPLVSGCITGSYLASVSPPTGENR